MWRDANAERCGQYEACDDTSIPALLNSRWLAATGRVHLNSGVIAAIVAEGKQLLTHNPQRKVGAN